MTNFNKLGARKEVGAIIYRLNDESLDDTLRSRIIRRHIANLAETLPAKFTEILITLNRAVVFKDWDEVRAGCTLINSLIPLTYGCIPAGTTFRAKAGGLLATKRKDGLDIQGRLHIATHLPADTAVYPEGL